MTKFIFDAKDFLNNYYDSYIYGIKAMSIVLKSYKEYDKEFNPDFSLLSNTINLEKYFKDINLNRSICDIFSMQEKTVDFINCVEILEDDRLKQVHIDFDLMSYILDLNTCLVCSTNHLDYFKSESV